MKRYLIYTFLQTCCIAFLQAQAPDIYNHVNVDRQINGDFLNLHKYWQYKEHFNAHHVVIGDAPGCSIPFSINGDACEVTYGTRTYPIVTNCTQDPSMNGNGGPSDKDHYFPSAAKAEIGENPAIPEYISVLATERGLLEVNNLNGINNSAIIKNNEHLFFALRTYFRLESAAVSLFQQASVGGFDPNNVGFQGFYIRDDMPYNFFKSGQPGETYGKDPNDPNKPGYNVEIGCVGGQLADIDYLTNPINKVSILMRGKHALNSGDQDREFFMALALVARFVPAQATYTYQGQTFNLLNMARDIADRLMNNYVGQGNDFPWIAQSPNWNSPTPQESILSPLCKRDGAGITTFIGITPHPRRMAVASESMFLSAFPTVKIHEFIKGSVNPALAATTTTPYSMQSIAYYGATTGLGVFATLIENLIIPQVAGFSSNFLMNSTPMSLWSDAFPIACTTLSGHETILKAYLREWSASNEGHNSIDEYTICKDHGILHYPIINALLYPSGDLNTNLLHKQELETLMREALSTAPDNCDGISWGPDKPVPNDWHYGFRWGAGENTDLYGDVTGLDYMLAYNLYHLFYLSSSPYYNTVDINANTTNTLYSDNFANEYPQHKFCPIHNNSQAVVYTNDYPAYEISDEVISASHLSQTGGPIKNNVSSPIYGGLICHGTNSVRLVDGFHAEAGAFFQAKVSPLACENSATPAFNQHIVRQSQTKEGDITVSDELVHMNHIIIHPNPATDHLIISGISGLGIIHTAEIFSMNGQSVQKESIESEQTEIELNVSALPQGIYILKVDTENGQQVQKFVKE